jgi:prepilin-type processing-associated H-X9-DG protein
MLGVNAKTPATPFLVGCVLFVWLVSLAGIVSNHVSLRKQGQSSSVGCVFVSLFAFGLVITAMLPPSSTVSEAALRSMCKNNLKELGRALHHYQKANGAFPLATSGDPAVSWRVQILPFVDKKKLFDKYVPGFAWNSEKNIPLSKTPVSSLLCPSAPFEIDAEGRYFSAYKMLAGPGTFSGDFKPRTPHGLSDGASNTLAIVEATGLNIIWTEPRDAQIDREPLGINFKGTGKYDSPGMMSSWHVGGAQAVFADGSVRFLSQDIDPKVLKALTTVDGGEPTDGWDAL